MKRVVVDDSPLAELLLSTPLAERLGPGLVTADGGLASAARSQLGLTVVDVTA